MVTLNVWERNFWGNVYYHDAMYPLSDLVCLEPGRYVTMRDEIREHWKHIWKIPSM